MNRVLHHIRRVALLNASNSPSDAELLELFLHRRDEAAFEAILRRHAPMVLGVCRRVLRHTQDAEDAFQATFLVLARKAASLRSRDLLGHWLYGIALRTALKARAMNHRRRARENRAGMNARPTEPADEPSEELLARLDVEIQRLPDKYRMPIVLCELQGKSRKDVAAMLGLPEGTLSWRLAYARKLLAGRLGTGAALCACMFSVALAREASAAVPGPLIRATVKTALRMIRGEILRAGTVPAHVLTLTDGVMRAMFLSKIKGIGAIVLALAVGMGGLTYHQAWAQTNKPRDSAPAARTTADELEELRLEVAALRKGLEVTRQRVKVLEDQLASQGRVNRNNPAAPGANPFGVSSNQYPAYPNWSAGADLAPTKPGTVNSVYPLADLQVNVPGSLPSASNRPGNPGVQRTARPQPDALHLLESAVKVLRKEPNNKVALRALDDALHQLRQERQHSELALPGIRAGSQPQGQPSKP